MCIRDSNTTIKYADIAALDLTEDKIFIDLAVPRDIEAEVGTLPHVTLFDIDHFPVCPCLLYTSWPWGEPWEASCTRR